MAIGFVVVLLVLATTSQGAFAISRWAPLALFTLAILIGALVARGAVGFSSRMVIVALAGIWSLAGWSMLSMVWAQSPADSFRGADRMILYAAIATLPFVVPISRRALATVGWALTIGIGAIAVYALLRLLIDGLPLFLAGRLNGPVNYRNATALLFVLPFWPLIIAAATRERRRGIRAVSLAVATLGLALSFLTQSRGVVLGLAAGAIIALVAGPDRVRRAWIAIISVGLVAIASPVLLHAYHVYNGGHGTVTAHDIRISALGGLAVSIAGFVVGLAIALFDTGLRIASAGMQRARGLARAGLALGVILALLGGLVAIGNPVSFARKEWHQFRDLNATTTTSTRYATISGQRYDLWRVALKEFAAQPIGGVGADNYAFDYYRYRATNRNLDDPHSLLFSLLSENGAVGVLLFGVFLGGVIGVLVRRWTTLDAQARRNAIAPAAAGAVLFGQCVVDWIWLIPGLTAVGFFALAVAGAQAVAPDGNPAPAAAPRSERRLWRLLRPLWTAGLVVAALAVLVLFLSDAYIQRARSQVDMPQAELAAAQTAATLNPWDVTPHYLQASALESLGQRDAAQAQLLEALRLEPDNSATLGVLGDFEARGRDLAAARAYYGQALALNPRDSGLQQLVHIGQATGRR